MDIYSFSYLPHKSKKLELFKKPINNIKELKFIFYDGRCTFFDKVDILHYKEGEEFIKVYSHLRKLALDLEKIFPDEKIPLLKKGTRGKKELTRKEVALIFLLSFFNIIDLKQELFHESNSFCVFDLLYWKYDSTFEFGRCFLNYLTIIGKWLSENNPILEEKIVYIRDTKEFNENIFEEEQKLCDIKIIEKGSLFDGDATYGVDFANKYIGGGVLNGGCVQEEILFAVEPEAIVSMFFMEVMEDNDAIRIDNTIQYSKYTGYGHDFKYDKSAVNVKDLSTIKKNKFIAIDASVQYTGKYGIFDKENILRDIHKAFVGFNLVNFEENQNSEEIIENKKNEEKNNEKKAEEKETKLKKKEQKSIGTGNWGCGVFGGDHELKFLQQWVAASFAGIERLDYYTYESKKMEFIINQLDKIKEKYSNANELYKDLSNKSLSKGEVLEILLGVNNPKKDDNSLYPFIK